MATASTWEQFVHLIHEDDALDGIKFSCFRIESKENDDYPKVAWIPRGGAIVRSDVLGGDPFGNCIVKLPFTDRVDAEIHLWGKDFAQAELLRNDIVASIDRLLGARFVPGGYETFNEQDGTAEWALSGVKMVLQVTVELVVGTEAKASNTVTTLTHTGTFEDHATGSTETVC